MKNMSMQAKAVDLTPEMLASFGGADEEEAHWQADPMYKEDLVQHTHGVLRTLMQSDEAYFRSLLAELNEQEIASVRTCFEQK